MKKIFAILTAVLLAISLAACGGDKTTENTETGGNSTQQTIKEPDKNAPLHTQLLQQSEINISLATELVNFGVPLQAESIYSFEQGNVSSLRLAIDYILWLKGEGENLAAVIGTAPFKNWAEIAGASPVSPMSNYFEGLINEIRGKTDEANACYQKAKANPYYTEQDFYYLRNESVESLYDIREQVVAVESKIYNAYTHHTALVTENATGEEYSPQYHADLAENFAANGNFASAYQCAVNALIAEPTNESLYSLAVYYALNADKISEAAEILNEGIWAFPDDAKINYFCAVIAYSKGEDASGYLEVAMQNGDDDLVAICNALKAEIGG